MSNMDDIQNTMKFSINKEKENKAKTILLSVYNSLNEKGYNPVNQIVGYIISGDPTYITSYNNARTLIRKLERDELLEEIVTYYIENNK
ncbi:MAG: IreB family regulatory phosphoprotein [Clostridia bacterium]|nr:IreB family regulatory phosphoprotein [Clostridia bacterium]